MTLKKAKRFHVFCLGLLMLIPLSSATAGFTGVVDYPARVQFPGVGHQTFHYAPAPYEWTNTRYNAYSWLQPSLAHIRNGPNWYDGRADRDGAWYNIDQRDGWLLASRSEWRVPASLGL